MDAKKRLFKVFLLGMVLSLMACAVADRPRAVAAAGSQDFYDRIANQQRRIDEGVRTGKLTRSEADTLQDNLNWVRNRHNQLVEQHMLTPPEMQKLDAILDQNNDMIYNKKHNFKKLY